MVALIFIETDQGKIKNTSLEALSYVQPMAKKVVAILFGQPANMNILEKAGADKILHVTDEKYSSANAVIYASALALAVNKENVQLVVMAKSILSDAVSARLSIKINASVVSNVIERPKISENTFLVKTSIYSGKAYANIEIHNEKKILLINKSTCDMQTDGDDAKIEPYEPNINVFDTKMKVIKTERVQRSVLLSEANIVVSGGRGMQGPENWHILEELAKILGAATGCSKPVSDMNWRPHHEHVGQTGIKVSPSLYIAIGISGAIQHLAGINRSRYILVINKDPGAPFFKIADYGILGDAFEVVPKLIETINKQKLE